MCCCCCVVVVVGGGVVGCLMLFVVGCWLLVVVFLLVVVVDDADIVCDRGETHLTMRAPSMETPYMDSFSLWWSLVWRQQRLKLEGLVIFRWMTSCVKSWFTFI